MTRFAARTATCPWCGDEIQVNANGRMRLHRVSHSLRKPGCEGSGRQVEQDLTAPGPARTVKTRQAADWLLTYGTLTDTERRLATVRLAHPDMVWSEVGWLMGEDWPELRKAWEGLLRAYRMWQPADAEATAIAATLSGEPLRAESG
jgi:hypothetical protein